MRLRFIVNHSPSHIFHSQPFNSWASPGGSAGEEPACNAGDTEDAGSIPGLERSRREEKGNPLQYSYLKNPMDRGASWAKVQSLVKHQI